MLQTILLKPKWQLRFREGGVRQGGVRVLQRSHFSWDIYENQRDYPIYLGDCSNDKVAVLTMHIFGRDVPASDDIWQLYSQIAQTPELWKPETFMEAATKCGLRKITTRRGYFSFSGKHNMTGQAPVVVNFIEEIRLFVGQEPKNLTEALYKKDRAKIRQLASEYSALFRQELGAPRAANDNDIFERNDHRVRILSTDCVWVVISNLPIIRQLPNDWWAPI